MANKRIYDLDENTSPAAGDYLPVDKSGNAEALKVNVSKLMLAATYDGDGDGVIAIAQGGDGRHGGGGGPEQFGRSAG